MRYTIENNSLLVAIESNGAEIRSVINKANHYEYMWQADPKYWGRTSPVLFPIVGSLKNKQYTFNGQNYPMSQHGFARDSEFEVISQNAESIVFRLTDNENTRKVYPFRFILEIGYTLSDNSLNVAWRVINPDVNPLYFSIGAHPAFNYPAPWTTSKEGYKLDFGNVERIFHHGNDRATGMSLREHIELPLVNGHTEITPTFFDRCTYIVEGRQTDEVSLVDPNGKKYVTVKFDAPLFAVWSPEEKNAPFVCIEPWYGRCDADDFDGTLEEREFGNCLHGGEVFSTSYDIIIR